MTMRRQAEADDHLMLLATIAQGVGAELGDYEPPSQRIRDYLAVPPDPGQPGRGEGRRLEILAAVEATGGEAG
jgi:hypothetical protein